ncbi:hypothetical protein P692DRAFT_20831725 [Suillus brevipes Sb2]|nr:hypothetical protein P692DRAFT_20831725 [Suillus brevipes Sb2]
MKLIDWFGDDHPEALNWFYRRDYNQSVLMALNTLWIICAYVFAALLLLPLGIIGMPNSLTLRAVTHAYVTALVTASHLSVVIQSLLISVLAAMMSLRVLLNVYPPFKLSQWSTTLVEQLRVPDWWSNSGTLFFSGESCG